MAEHLGPLEVCCDAPPYGIVQACHLIGFQTPEDVRWCRLSHFLQIDKGWLEPFFSSMQRWALGRSGPQTCSCGHAIPPLERYAFTALSGDELLYVLGQCQHCHTVFWEDG